VTKTKIVVTLGPACDSEAVIKGMMKLGVSIFRFNTKHGDLKWHGERIDRVRKVARELGHTIAILVDLKGPELRVGAFPGGQIELVKNERVCFIEKDPQNNEKNIVIKELNSIKGLRPGSTIYLDDGYLETKVVKVEKKSGKVTAKVIEGGPLKNNKGINFPAVNVDLPSLIAKDLQFISMPGKRDIDYFGYSFVRNREDMLHLKKAIKAQGLKARVVAKIENKQAIDNFEEILAEADAIMVARGDLGIEIPLERVPFYQKMFVKRCREVAKPVIVATQMLESMIQKPRPTRAEVADVANAIYDGTDAVMLSGETAGGRFPLKAVKVMKRIADFIEDRTKKPRISFKPQSLSELITFSAHKLIQNKHKSEFIKALNIKAFIVFTDTGATARYLSRFRPSVPIISVSEDKQIRDQLCLSYGVKPVCYTFPEGEMRSTKAALLNLKNRKILEQGDRVVVIYGKQWGVAGQTNTIRVEEVE